MSLKTAEVCLPKFALYEHLPTYISCGGQRAYGNRFCLLDLASFFSPPLLPLSLPPPNTRTIAQIVVELGAGPGLPGLVLSRICRRVFLTDFADPVLRQCHRNVTLNNAHLCCRVRRLDWVEEGAGELEREGGKGEQGGGEGGDFCWTEDDRAEFRQCLTFIAADVRQRVHVRGRVHVGVGVHVGVCVHVCVRVCVHVRVRVLVRVRVCVHVRVCARVRL